MKSEVAIQQILTEYNRHAGDDDYNIVAVAEATGELQARINVLTGMVLAVRPDKPQLRRLLKEVAASAMRSMVDLT